MIQLKDIRLRGFRCFEDCTIEFDPGVTILVARNGQGKTAILDAVALALGLFVDTIGGTSQWRGFNQRDVRRTRGTSEMSRAEHVEFETTAVIDMHSVSWRRWMRGSSSRARTSTQEARGLVGIAKEYHDRLNSDAIDDTAVFDLPFVAYYGTNRRWENPRTSRRRSALPRNERCLGYADCLDSAASYGLFVGWYVKKYDRVSHTPVAGIQKSNRPEVLLAAVNRAVDDVLQQETGWHGLHWDAAEEQLMLEHPTQGRLPLSFLSDGVRNTVAMVADVAHRCVRLNPHYGDEAASRTSGVILVDEVDLHLHPEWQQTIVRLLRAAFPHLQLVASTHSPQVLSTVDFKSIRLIDFSDGDATVQLPEFQTQGVESADVLARVMEVDPVPQIEQAKWLSRYRAFLQAGQQDTNDALRLWDQLVSHFGMNHPALEELTVVRRLQDFKRDNDIPLN